MAGLYVVIQAVQITARLVETSTARSVWAERYDRQLEDVFAIQDEIGQNIAKVLQVMLTETEKRAIQKAPTTDVQAYDYYLRGSAPPARSGSCGSMRARLSWQAPPGATECSPARNAGKALSCVSQSRQGRLK